MATIFGMVIFYAGLHGRCIQKARDARSERRALAKFTPESRLNAFLRRLEADALREATQHRQLLAIYIRQHRRYPDE